MMPAALKIAGQKFNRLLAIRPEGKGEDGKFRWLFQCDCGKEHRAVASNVKSGHVKSCGCLKIEVSHQPNSAEANRKTALGKLKHGASDCKITGKRAPEYGVWKGIRQRCNNPNNDDYQDYGGRGIRVCERWDDFASFLADIGPRPSSRHSINRRNNDGNYEPGNCHWATDLEQANNRRKRRWAKAPKETTTCPSL